ncbi:olfactory receptor 6B1-like [Pelobates fuscus]|uniref:olfactory receptor 6B1-like n=1 Tax=Pelobates fuscus TaxID=191477 RepID=UPI002FE4E1C0
MLEVNQTVVTEFLLLGFQNLRIFNIILYFLFLVIYILTLGFNLLIISLVAKFQNLKSPMYFFLSHLSLCDILLTTNITPKMLLIIITGGSTISIKGCITQLYFYGASATTECLLLTVMSYDRYVAILTPLHYTSVMDPRLPHYLALWSWVLSCTISLVIACLIHTLVFCGPHVIDHYFCDFAPLVELSCSDSTVVEMVDFILSIPLVIFPLFFIIYTYVRIFITIFRIPSTSGKHKAFSTCSSHLIVVSMYYGTLITIYMTPSKWQLLNVNKVLSLLYTMGTPFINPIIYSLRNHEIKEALKHFNEALTLSITVSLT